MKIICLQEKLKHGLEKTERIVGRNITLPILQNILISCEKKKGRVKLSSTDLEIGTEIIIPAKIEEEGKTTVPAKLFVGLIKNLPDERIEATLKNNIWILIFFLKELRWRKFWNIFQILKNLFL